jgi:hypothetical protein
VADAKFDLSALSLMPKLRKIHFEDGQVKDEIEGLRHIPHIVNVKIPMCGHSTRVYTFPILSNLVKLDIFAHICSKKDMKSLAFCSNLKKLQLRGFWTFDDIPDLSHLGKLENVQLSIQGLEDNRLICMPNSIRKITVGHLKDLMSYSFEDPNHRTSVKIRARRSNGPFSCNLKIAPDSIDMWNGYVENFSYSSDIPVKTMTLRVYDGREAVDFSNLIGVQKIRLIMREFQINILVMAKLVRFSKDVTHLRIIIRHQDMVSKVERMLRLRYPSVEIICTQE